MDHVVFGAVLAAALMHAGWNAVIKTGLDRQASILLLSMVQSVIALLVLPFVAAPAAAAWPWIAGSALLHTGYKLFLIRAYTHGDLAQVYPLARGAAPLIVALVGVAILGEVLSGPKFAAILAISLGVIAMAQKGGAQPVGASKGSAAATTVPARIPAKALGYALITGGFTAAYTLVDGIGARLSGAATGFTMAMFVTDGLCMIACATAARGRHAYRGLAGEWKSGLVAGAMSLGSYWIAIWAFTLAPVALVASLRETSVLFAVLIAALILKEPVGRWLWCGAALITLGIALMRW
jgi:drug/metabolite transporter (DMT)-like permease